MERLTISAAIRRGKRLKGQIDERTTRARQAACFEKGKEPAFSYNACIEERDKLVDELLRLEVAVAHANAMSTTQIDGKSILFTIRKLAEIRGEISFYRTLPVRAKVEDVEVEENREYDTIIEKYVMKKKETVHISAISKAKQAEVIERLQLEHERINAELEDHNHKTYVNY